MLHLCIIGVCLPRSGGVAGAFAGGAEDCAGLELAGEVEDMGEVYLAGAIGCNHPGTGFFRFSRRQ